MAGQYVEGKIVVELGCGTGYGANILVQCGAKKVIATDIDPLAITSAKKRQHHTRIMFKEADASRTSLPSGRADVVICFEMIEHVQNPATVIKEAKRLLKPHGILILSTPNADMSFHDNPYHVQEFVVDELREILDHFSIITFFGQRKVNKTIMRCYQFLSAHIRNPRIRQFLRFRPWEGYTIFPLEKRHPESSLYLIALCQK